MSEEKQTINPADAQNATPANAGKQESKAAGKRSSDEPKGDRRDGDRRGGGRGPRGRRPQEPQEFEQKILDLARVTRVTAGGKRMRFRACVIIGDVKTHRVAQGTAKGLDVADAVNKAVKQAKKQLITVPVVNETLPHAVETKFAAAKVMLKPASQGAGVKAGGAVRVVLEMAGVPNATAKMLGSKNKINNAKATLQALALLKKVAKTQKSEAVAA